MIPFALEHVLLLAIIAISIALMLIRPRGIAEVYWIGGGVLGLLALRLVRLGLVGHAITKGFDVYLFLIGMMLLAELAREYGLFQWVSAVAVRSARGSCTRLFTLIYGVGTVVTIGMSNDATAVVLTPAILTAVKKAKVQPMPHLFACALIANAASFVLPISNPANLVVFQTGMPSLGRWLIWFGVPSLLAIAVTYLLMRILFRKELRAPMSQMHAQAPLTKNGMLVLGGLVAVIGVLLSASAIGWKLGAPVCISALILTAAVSWRAWSNPFKLARRISWKTLLLVAGLFVMVDAVESVGALQATTGWLARAARANPIAQTLGVGFAVGVANNLVNNLPLGLIAGATLQGAQAHDLLKRALLIGIDIGPNLSVTGSLATILWLLALKKEKLDVGFFRFLKIGAVVMPVTLFVSLGAVVLMHLLAPT